MYELKTVSIKSSARVLSFSMIIIYLVFSVISLITGSTDLGSGLVSLVIGVVLFGIIGAVLGLIIAWAYNFSSKKWGGLHLDFRPLDDVSDQHGDTEQEKSGE